jgi:PII-like signaling protein
VSDLTQMSFHFGERDRDRDGPLEAAVMDACARRGVRAAALLRAAEGYGARHAMRTDRLLSLSEDAPLVAVAVGEGEPIEALAVEVREMASEGLLVLVPTTTGLAEPSAAAGPAMGEHVKVTIWGPRSGPRAPHRGAVAALRRHGARAATVLLGVDGVLRGARRRARFLAANRGVTALTVGVGPRAAIDAAIAEIGVAASLVTVEPVEICPPAAEETLPAGLRGPRGDAVRVTLVTSEVASRGSGPTYLDFIRRLRREGAAGATAQRGVWGFRGQERPHGDRVLALRRDVPMVVEVVDSAERAGRWLELAATVAGDGDVVYSQAVGRRLAPG